MCGLLDVVAFNLEITIMKYLPLYYRWCKKDKLPSDGLCRCFKNDNLFYMLCPPVELNAVLYWGFAGDDPSLDEYFVKLNRYYKFSPLRQNIVLFLAAMNNEL